MAYKSKITALSTFTNDVLIKNGKIIGTQKGGPAFYIQQALMREQVLFSLITATLMTVEILLTKKGEFGRVLNNPVPKKVNFSKIRVPYLIISSVLNEFDLSELPKYQGKVFLDIQGYVRNGNDFGKKSLWRPQQEIFNKIFCLKGTQEELAYLPARYIQTQKQKILLITKGVRGCEAFIFGKRFLIKPTKKITAQNTIGAGDSFLAYFVANLIIIKNVFTGVKYATKKTAEFLITSKQHHWHNLLL